MSKGNGPSATAMDEADEALRVKTEQMTMVFVKRKGNL